MSAEARANGWRGFEGLGKKVPGGYEYQCDGMPSMMGCGASCTITVEYKRVGLKSTGWLVCYGLDSIDGSKPMDDPKNQVEDRDIVLTFCPRCVAQMDLRKS